MIIGSNLDVGRRLCQLETSEVSGRRSLAVSTLHKAVEVHCASLPLLRQGDSHRLLPPIGRHRKQRLAPLGAYSRQVDAVAPVHRQPQRIADESGCQQPAHPLVAASHLAETHLRHLPIAHPKLRIVDGQCLAFQRETPLVELHEIVALRQVRLVRAETHARMKHLAQLRGEAHHRHKASTLPKLPLTACIADARHIGPNTPSSQPPIAHHRSYTTTEAAIDTF
ncbi:MAG: hypothetical protein IJU19_00350 [Bacteroidales bacterium]|nr:hypothetical protein [Bacteroidales bacterium]